MSHQSPRSINQLSIVGLIDYFLLPELLIPNKQANKRWSDCRSGGLAGWLAINSSRFFHWILQILSSFQTPSYRFNPADKLFHVFCISASKIIQYTMHFHYSFFHNTFGENFTFGLPQSIFTFLPTETLLACYSFGKTQRIRIDFPSTTVVKKRNWNWGWFLSINMVQKERKK